MSRSTTTSLNLPNQHLFTRDGKQDYFEYGAPLYEASIQGDWKSAEAILDKRPDLVRYSLTENGETSLHVAASADRSKQMARFVDNLLKKMYKDDHLELQNNNGDTALYLAAATGNLETVQSMLNRNKTLQNIPGGPEGNMMPLYAAVLYGNKVVAQLLYRISDHLSEDGWNGQTRSWLLEKSVENDMFVFAFIGLKMEMPEDKGSQALKLLRIIWEDIVKKPTEDIDKILKGPPDLIKPDHGSVLQTIQLKELISEQLEEMENTYKHEHRFPELKKLVSRYVLKMHTETHSITNNENKTHSSNRDQAQELKNIILKNIMKLHDDSLEVNGARIRS